MRRSMRYTAGLIIAAGAGLAFAAPAAAAPATPPPSWFTPYTYSAPTQFLGQGALSQQTVVGNTGNGQLGAFNTNGGGYASAGNSTSQSAYQSVGGLFQF